MHTNVNKKTHTDFLGFLVLISKVYLETLTCKKLKLFKASVLWPLLSHAPVRMHTHTHVHTSLQDSKTHQGVKKF